MTFALETQHGKKFRYGVRIEEMLIVHAQSCRSEISLQLPQVKQITVVDPLPGYGGPCGGDYGAVARRLSDCRKCIRAATEGRHARAMSWRR